MYTLKQLEKNFNILMYALINTMKKHNINTNAFAIDIINLANTELFDSKGNIVEIDC